LAGGGDGAGGGGSIFTDRFRRRMDRSSSLVCDFLAAAIFFL